MFEGKKVYAIIGAAGSGKRMAAPLPKQFIKLSGGKTILETTVEQFEKVLQIDKIIIVTAEEYVNLCCQFFLGKEKIRVVIGGRERQDSIWNGLKSIGSDEKNSVILIHDGARPYVTTRIIEDVIEAASHDGAAIAAVPTKDTIRHKEEGTLNRKMLFNVQTPQGFNSEILFRAFQKAFKDGFYGTDDASLVERLGENVTIVRGEESNIKITTREDLKEEMRIGSGYDVHRLVEERELILGGVKIPFEKGLLGHSDADVLIHALMDAILGAAALGDIGKHFPDTDEKYMGISSIELLKNVDLLIKTMGYSLGNADITVICQRPKLAEYIPIMRKNISEALGVSEDIISIKATTTEKLGFTGRCEGIAAEAVCLLKR